MAQQPETSAVAPPAGRSRWSLARFQEAGLLGVILALAFYLSIYGYYDAAIGKPNKFLSPANLIDGVATPMSYYAIMAIGLTIVIVSGGIDISVGSIMALSGMSTAAIMHNLMPGVSGAAAVLVAAGLCTGIGLVCGLINASLVALLRMHPFIVTLGTLSIFRCLATTPFANKTISSADSVRDAFNAQAFGVRIVPMLVMVAVVAGGWIYLRMLAWGRETYAVGGNEEAARFSGINVTAVKIRVYAISGALAGLAGLVSLGMFGTMSSSTATGYELTVVAGAVVGGASLAGGRGTAIGALLGTLVLALIENAIDITHLDQQWKQGIVGLSIIIAVAFDRLGGQWRASRGKGAKAIAPAAAKSQEKVTPSSANGSHT